ncbi:MAG TPA: adenylosuccinate synthase [Thermoanaerobaculia bacterium]|nr:adenylosuccinate synthase [Thermoanaerobaculia bacterium]
MSNLVIIGMQWGDEGKGKIVDLLCPAFGVVVRYQGGHNAGHTVKFGDRHFSLHLIPSGILHPGTNCVLGNGMVINPDAFFEELENLIAAGVEVEGNLFVSSRAQTILPLHSILDQAREGALGEGKIGTTARGIGPAYELKAARLGVRLGDLGTGDLRGRLEAQHKRIAHELNQLGSPKIPSVDELEEQCRAWASRLAPYLKDTSRLLNQWLSEGGDLLFEGAQGALLDVDHGTYPFVTSSNATAGGAATGSGVPPTAIDGVLGVLKAYTTRVGGGPFVGELEDEMGEELRKRGNEYGTTTGRPRRCGWLDMVAARHAQLVNGVDVIALTKLDILDHLEEVPVCVGYRYKGEVLRDFPSELGILESAEPVFEIRPGWKSDTTGVVDFIDLPQQAKDYISFIEDGLDAPVGIVSSGPRREETIVREVAPLRRLTENLLDSIVAGRGRLGSS